MDLAYQHANYAVARTLRTAGREKGPVRRDVEW